MHRFDTTEAVSQQVRTENGETRLIASANTDSYLGSYFRSFNEIEELIALTASKEYEPLSRRGDIGANNLEKMRSTMTAAEIEDESPSKPARLGKSIWNVMHRAQGFETRFGLKTTAVISLLAVPAWLSQSNGWWDYYEAWWAVIMAWLIMAPR